MKEERRKKIIEILKQEHTVSTSRVCELTKASLNTIRADFAALEKEGSLVRFYGGISLPSSPIQVVPSAEREHRNTEQKLQIAAAAAALIENRDVIYIDDGTTCSQIIACADKNFKLTVITPSVLAVNAAVSAELTNFTIIFLGGQLDFTARSCLGASVNAALENYNFSKIFMSCTALSLSSGVTEGAPLEAEKKRILMSSNGSKILLADASKFDTAAAITYAELKDYDTLITDKKLNDTYRQYLSDHKLNLVKV